MTDAYELILISVVKRSLATPATDPELRRLTFASWTRWTSLRATRTAV
jgi:hypothetical protein